MKSNFHTHTKYCDGKNTCEELVLKAVEKGFEAIGFSGHSYTEFDESYCMSKENTLLYADEIKNLKRLYNGKIRIYTGIEQDYYAPKQEICLDYIIGAAHYVFKNGVYIPVDCGAKEQTEAVNKYYGGDFYLFAEDYYKTVSDIVNKTGCDIIAHFDLISKFNERYVLFDENNARYIEAWKSALDALVKTDAVFEVNMGAVAQGRKTAPYPSADMLKYIAKKGGRVIITTDCHNADNLDFGQKTAEDLIMKSGVELCDFEAALRSKNRLTHF